MAGAGKYRVPPGTVIEGSKWSVKFIAWNIESYSRIRLSLKGGPGDGGSMATYFRSRADAELWSEKNRHDGKGRWIYPYDPSKKYPSGIWVVGVPWTRTLFLLAMTRENQCDIHKKLAGHLIAVGQANNELQTKNRARFSHSSIARLAKEFDNPAEIIEAMEKRWGSKNKKRARLEAFRDEQWHEAVMANRRILQECPARAEARISVMMERAALQPHVVAQPEPIMLDVTVGDVQ